MDGTTVPGLPFSRAEDRAFWPLGRQPPTDIDHRPDQRRDSCPLPTLDLFRFQSPKGWVVVQKQVAGFDLPHLLRPSTCERAHWWLTDPSGSVIDPTAAQFPSKGCCVYTPWEEGAPEPTGMCPNCGEHVYDGGTCCSDACGRAYAAYCMNPG